MRRQGIPYTPGEPLPAQQLDVCLGKPCVIRQRRFLLSLRLFSIGKLLHCINNVQIEYKIHESVEADILFAFHALNEGSKKAFLSMTAGMLMQDCNIQNFGDDMDKATAYTLDRLQKAVTGELNQ